jgi:hypothetical protein
LKTETISQLLAVHDMEIPKDVDIEVNEQQKEVFISATEDFLEKKTRYLKSFMESHLDKIQKSKTVICLYLK